MAHPPDPHPSDQPRTAAAFAAAPGEPGHGAAELPRRALLRLYAVALLVALASLVPYATPRLADYRYWDRLDLSPLARAVGLGNHDAAERAAPDPGPLHAAPPPTAERELDDGDLAKMAGLAPAATAVDGAAAALAAGISPSDALQIGADVLGDQKTWIEGELQLGEPFFRALVELSQGRRSHVRIGHWGDSHIANDGLSHVTRLLLQKRFGDGGHGFTLVQGRTEWYLHKGIERQASGWRLFDFLNGNARDGAYGYGGVSAEGGPGAQLTLKLSAKTAADRVVVYYRSLGKAQLGCRVDGKTLTPLEVGAASGTDGVHTWQVSDGPHSVTLRVQSGRVRIHGVAFERAQGLVYDTLGEVGARGLRWVQADADHLKTVMTQRAPDLLILNYGGNERSDKLSEATYLRQLADVIARFKAGRTSVACLLIGPSDHGVRSRGRIVSDPGVVRLVGWQRKAAAANGCLFWDSRAAMGGEGAMGRWVKEGLGWSDYSHFTASGERAMGLATYRALLQALQRWQQQQPRHAK